MLPSFKQIQNYVFLAPILKFKIQNCSFELTIKMKYVFNLDSIEGKCVIILGKLKIAFFGANFKIQND